MNAADPFDPSGTTPAGDSAPTFSLDDLAARVELPVRTVRYYIQLGLVDRPVGAGKGAYYTPRHLEQLLHIRKWQLAGLSLERIGELRRQEALGGDAGGATGGEGPSAARPLPPTPRRPGTVEVWSHLVVADGVEVVLEPGKAGLSPEQVRAFFRAVTDAYAAVQQSADAPARANHAVED